MRARFPFPTLVVAILTGGVCASAETAGNIHHNADVRLDPASRSVQVTDRVEIEAGGKLLFRLSKLLKPTLVQVNGAQVSPIGRSGIWSIPAGDQGPKRV